MRSQKGTWMYTPRSWGSAGEDMAGEYPAAAPGLRYLSRTVSRTDVHCEVLPNGLTVLLREARLAPVAELVSSDQFTPEDGQKLQSKCIEALSKAYSSDTEGGDKNAAVVWREKNGQLYRESESFISAIVQNWYLSVGRQQEKKAAGCASVVVGVGVGTLLIAWMLLGGL